MGNSRSVQQTTVSQNTNISSQSDSELEVSFEILLPNVTDIERMTAIKSARNVFNIFLNEIVNKISVQYAWNTLLQSWKQWNQTSRKILVSLLGYFNYTS